MMDVIHVGKVNIKIFEGTQHTLEDVAYVPKIQIFLSLLVSKDYGYRVRGGVLKISWGYIGLMNEDCIKNHTIWMKHSKDLKGLDTCCTCRDGRYLQ